MPLPHDAGAGAADHPVRPVRLGVHGSPRTAAELVAAAGRDRRDVEFVPYDVADPFGPLRAGEMDVLLVKYALREPDLAFGEPLLFDDRALLLGAHHPLATRATVSVEEVADYDAFSCPGDFPPYVWDQVVPPRTPGGRPVRRVHPMTTVEGMVDLLARSTAVHPSFRSLEDILPPHIRAVPLHDLPPAPVSLAWRNDAQLPIHVRQFITDVERSTRR
ncbi:LysR substrate-binding domain-containing protein [Streptomyces sp. NPDC059008]|uniref:LysR substrate-binding domain-containing protein n=1 Tax=Streptomyces sp. NPDC059008 TaxID=3346693 RepID=UPI0036BA017A